MEKKISYIFINFLLLIIVDKNKGSVDFVICFFNFIFGIMEIILYFLGRVCFREINIREIRFER